MKKIFQNSIVSKLILMVSFLSVQAIALADAPKSNNTYTMSEFFSQGWVWGVIALMIGFMVAAFLVDRPGRHNEPVSE